MNMSDLKCLPSSCLSLILIFLTLYLTPSPSTQDEPGQLKIYLPKKLLECLPKCSSLPKERHRWNTNEVRKRHTRMGRYP
uniref:Calmodulin binding transcription activator 1 n=1 Tax=Fundulus heteroclitus TaxID=8078 RepID=A0A3Q2P0X5_FUNHE